MTFVQSASDVAWTKNQMSLLAIGGYWMYQSAPIVFRKTAEGVLAVVKTDPMAVPGRVYDPAGIEREVQKVRICVEAAGYRFDDLRGSSGGVT